MYRILPIALAAALAWSATVAPSAPRAAAVANGTDPDYPSASWLTARVRAPRGALSAPLRT
jgi:hypothetical protein